MNKKKIGGILVETKKTGSNDYAIIGVGLNINQQTIPEELDSIASSLRIENSNSIQREPLLAFILNEFEVLYNSDITNWISLWRKHCNHLNKNDKYFQQYNFSKLVM